MKWISGVYSWGVWLGVSLAALACAGGAGELTRFESTQTQMGVPFKLVLYAPDEATAKSAFEAAFARVAELNRILSDYDPDSELSRLSKSAPMPRPVKVSKDLWQVLARSQQLAEQTGGAFDVTVGPYVRLWRRARRSKEMPSAERLAEARAGVGYRLMQLDERNRTVQLLGTGMKLDLGGIAMGYAVDEAMKVLQARGINRALIDASGDILVSDPPPGKPGWTINILPLGEEGTPSRDVVLANRAVTTAGDAFQHVVLDGRRYSHIVDPRTGLGLVDQHAVAVIANDCLTADSLDTALSVLSPQAGLALAAKTPGVEVLLVLPLPQHEVRESPGFGRYLFKGAAADGR